MSTLDSSGGAEFSNQLTTLLGSVQLPQPNKKPPLERGLKTRRSHETWYVDLTSGSLGRPTHPPGIVSHATCGADFRHVSTRLGSTGALIYLEIRRCLRLRGGDVIDGIKWIFKSATQLAERFGLNERTVRRHLNEQVKQGLWNREKKEAKWGKQVYWYSVGEVDLLSGPVRSDQAKRPDQPDKMSASKTRTSTFRKTLPRPASGNNNQQPVSWQVIEERQKAEEAHEEWAGSPAHLEAIAQAKAVAKRQQPTALTRKDSQRPPEAPVRPSPTPLGSLTSSSPSSSSYSPPGPHYATLPSPSLPPSQVNPQSPLASTAHSSPLRR